MKHRSGANPDSCTTHESELAELRAELDELRVRLDSWVALVVYTSSHPEAERLRADRDFSITRSPARPRGAGRPALQVVRG